MTSNDLKFSSIQADDETETDVPQLELPLVKGETENEKNDQTWPSNNKQMSV